MEIVHEVAQLDYGGVERVVRNIIKHDKINQHKIITYKDGPFRSEFEKVGAKIIVINNDDPIDESADIIHVHTGGDVSNMALMLGKSFPVIETIHSPVRSPLGADFVCQRIGVSEAVSALNADCATIRNGLDFEDMAADKTPQEVRADLGIPEGKVVIGRLGRLGRDKGLEEWLLTCAELQHRGLDFVPLVVGGEARDCDGYLGHLKLMAASLPVKGVIWTGHRVDTQNLLQIMDVFLYPSPTEGFGLVFAEAMFAGAVVVAYKTPVTEELFAGYSILTERTIKGLADGAVKAMDSAYQDAFSGICHDFVKAEYDAATMSKEYQRLYTEVKG